MARTYLIFEPRKLPLAPGELGEDTVASLADTPEVRARLAQVFPALEWRSVSEATATVDGNWYEVHLGAADSTLSLRCSLRADHAAFIQSLCDSTGWLAIDERPVCFQPHHPPIAA